jgi:hypothetical protein
MPFAAIEWRAPWLAPYRLIGERAAMRVLEGEPVAQALNAERDPAACPVVFAPQAALPAGEAYEAFIFRTGQVPTRDNLHDFFNGLVWLHKPGLKQQMNRLQAADIARDGVGATRGSRRDALTLLDENGAVLDAPPAIAEALVQRDWSRLFGPLRPQWTSTRLTLLGHALLEKLVRPRKPVTAHVLLPTALEGLDGLTPAQFAPLPVLGVPGWWPANESPAFYDDASVFRPAGSRPPTGSAPRCRS